MTKAKATQAAREWKQNGIGATVYQFPRGHWGYATERSPIGQSLRENGMIYPELGCRAAQIIWL